VIDNVAPEMDCYKDEIFGPVLSVVRVKSYDEALALLDANPYGNGTAIFTNGRRSRAPVPDEVEVGMVGINVPIPVPMVTLVRRWKASLFGAVTPWHGGPCTSTREQRRSPRAGLTLATAGQSGLPDQRLTGLAPHGPPRLRWAGRDVCKDPNCPC